MKHLIALTKEELNLLQTALLGFKVDQPDSVQKVISELELNIISQIRDIPNKPDKDFTGLNPCYNLSDTLK